MGAALLANDGRFFTGANVENASYGLTMCAERTAIFAAVASGVRALRALAVTSPDVVGDAGPAYRMPCGACRQVIAEFALPEIEVTVDGVGVFGLNDLLPTPFTLGRLPMVESVTEKPRLYSDLDNVLCRTDECMRELIREVTGGRVSYAYENIREFDYRNCIDAKGERVTSQEWHLAHTVRFSRAEVVAKLLPVPGANEQMQQLASSFDVAYITGRKPWLQEATQTWLKSNGFPDGPVVFAERGQKHLVVAGALALIEDDREQTEPAAKAGMHAILLAHPWNETDSSSLSHRCADWGAITNLLRELAGRQLAEKNEFQ